MVRGSLVALLAGASVWFAPVAASAYSGGINSTSLGAAGCAGCHTGGPASTGASVSISSPRLVGDRHRDGEPARIHRRRVHLRRCRRVPGRHRDVRYRRDVHEFDRQLFLRVRPRLPGFRIRLRRHRRVRRGHARLRHQRELRESNRHAQHLRVPARVHAPRPDVGVRDELRRRIRRPGRGVRRRQHDQR